MDRSNPEGLFIGPNEIDCPVQKPKEVYIHPQVAQGILPVFVRQIMACPDEEFNLFGISPIMVTIVGKLRKYDLQTTKAVFDIEDRTGSISAVLWLEIDSSCEPRNLPLVKEGRYVRVYGSLRNHENVKSLVVFHMYPVEQLNEIVTHVLEVIHARLETENLSIEDRITANHLGHGLVNSTGGHVAALTGLQAKVYNILKHITIGSGLSTSSVLSLFSLNQHNDVKCALEWLISEGLVYTTVDDDHYKVTEVT